MVQTAPIIEIITKAENRGRRFRGREGHKAGGQGLSLPENTEATSYAATLRHRLATSLQPVVWDDGWCFQRVGMRVLVGEVYKLRRGFVVAVVGRLNVGCIGRAGLGWVEGHCSQLFGIWIIMHCPY